MTPAQLASVKKILGEASPVDLPDYVKQILAAFEQHKLDTELLFERLEALINSFPDESRTERILDAVGRGETKASDGLREIRQALRALKATID